MTSPDPLHGSPAAEPQMPQMGSSGPAPLGAGDYGQRPEPPVYEAAPLDMAPADGYVLHGVTNLGTTQDPSAYDINGNPGPSGLATSYYGGQVYPAQVYADNDAGGRDTLSDSVAGAVANATARWQEMQGDTYKAGPVVGTVVHNEPFEAARPQQEGSTVGDLMQFPPAPLDPGAGVGNTMPTAGFFDPPRGYGGEAGAPGYNTGNEPPPAGEQGSAQ